MMQDNNDPYSDFHGVYILHTVNPVARQKNIYIGYTNNPAKRVVRHNKGDQFGGII